MALRGPSTRRRLSDSDEGRLDWYKKSAALLGNRFADAVAPSIPMTGYIRPPELRHAFCSTEGQDERQTRSYMINVVRLGDIIIANILWGFEQLLRPCLVSHF